MASAVTVPGTGLAPPPPEKERQILEAAADWATGCATNLSAAVLNRLNAEMGIEFATAVAYQSVRNSPRHVSFVSRIEALHDAEHAPLRSPGFRIAIVPGAFFREHPGTGADGQLLVKEFTRLGYPTEVLPLPSFRRLSDGAAQIRQWLDKQDQRPLVLVSLSTGGAEVKLAFAAEETAFERVIAWIDLSGIVEGTALIDWLRRQWLRHLAVRGIFWWRGYPPAGLEDLRRGAGTLLAGPLKIPAHILAIHVLGFPLRCHLRSPMAQRGHQRLAPLGPNDGGGILLGDATQRPGLIYPVWGEDHYLRPTWDIRRLVARLVRYVEEEALCPIA